MMIDSRPQLLRWIASEQDRLIVFLQAFARIDTSNPPGDTRAGADFICKFFEREGLPYRVAAAQETMPNLICTCNCGGPGRHLVLNGHIDVFPVGDRTLWSRDPWSGEIVDGRIYGRGTVDMKCGTTASLFTYVYLHRLRHELKGNLTLTLVSDEETGGRWGTAYLLDRFPDEVMGDCVLNGEPSSPQTIRFGEKATLWLRCRVKTPGGHGAYPHLSASATKIAARVILELERIETLKSKMPVGVVRQLAQPEVQSAMEQGLGRGAADVAQRVTMNIGTLHGGVKVNMLPGECAFEADLRLPIGIARKEVLAEVGKILKKYPEVTVEHLQAETADASWCDPEGEMVGIIQENVEALMGFRPPAVVSLGATDCRFWRQRGVPAYVYGPSPEGMGKPDESVSIDEFLHVVRTHVLSSYEYLSRS